MRETWVQSLGWEDPLEEVMATCSSIPAWRIPMDRGAWGGYSPWGRRESDMTEQLSTMVITNMMCYVMFGPFCQHVRCLNDCHLTAIA